uniref:hypothetical protein n=1 Tax=Klebsiella aerogenes TaxID=548 RepID=UPI001E306944|nr:hypothetical protein [Klebsiella aerogenes]
MNTQNVNVKTATKESSERWGSDPKARLACVIAEQKSYLIELCGVWNLQLSQKDEAEEILRLLSLMSDNVHREGVLLLGTFIPACVVSCRAAVVAG